MNRFLVSTAACLALLVASHVARAADEYKVDMSHTSVIFSVNHLNFSYCYGRFNRAEGAFTIDASAPENSQFKFVVDATSIDTNDKKRDAHLSGQDFFSVNEFPTITFQSTAVKPTTDGMEVTGELTMHGVTKQVVLPFVKLGEGKSPFNDERIGFLCQTQVNRSDFGMTNMLEGIGDEVAITLSFEGVKQ
jgi:polyisoprenoid-binding protein YceI